MVVRKFVCLVTFFTIAILIIPSIAQSQENNVFLHPKKFYKKFFPKLKIKRDPPDSAYIKSYPNFLAVGVHVLSPAIRNDIFSKSSENGALKFRTNIADIVGFSASYRFIAAGFALLLKSGLQTHQGYSRSYYRTATIKYNGSAYSLQFKYLRFKGLTDINMPTSIAGYRQRPDIVSKEFKFEGLYNRSWRKYSYIAPFTFSQRQVKSRGGFLFKAGVYYNQLHGDSVLVAKNGQYYFDGFQAIKIIRTLSIKLAPGVGGNLVFLKRYYVSLTAFPSYDLYIYKYLKQDNERVKGKRAFILALEGTANVGYQSKRMYAGLRYEVERRQASLQGIRNTVLYTYLGLEFGYRFKTPRIVKKIYKETMPPGM